MPPAPTTLYGRKESIRLIYVGDKGYKGHLEVTNYSQIRMKVATHGYKNWEAVGSIKGSKVAPMEDGFDWTTRTVMVARGLMEFEEPKETS